MRGKGTPPRLVGSSWGLLRALADLGVGRGALRRRAPGGHKSWLGTKGCVTQWAHFLHLQNGLTDSARLGVVVRMT